MKSFVIYYDYYYFLLLFYYFYYYMCSCFNCVCQVAEAFLASRIPCAEQAAARGMNFGGYAVFSDAQCNAILERNMPVFEK